MTTAAAPGAPAQAETTTVSASMAAAGGSDFAAFERAEQAKLSGKPLEAVEVSREAEVAPAAGGPGGTKQPAGEARAAAAEVVPGTENRQTRAEKEQARINETIRTATAAVEQPLKARIAELEALVKTPPAERPGAAAAEPPAKGTPEWKRYQALPDAPNIGDFESVADHNAAMAFFIAKTMLSEERAGAERTAHVAEQLTAAQQRVDTFYSRLDEAKKDPTWVTKLSPEVKALKPFGALDKAKGDVAGPANFVAEEIMDSEVAPQMMEYLSQPGELDKILAMPELIARMSNPRAQYFAHMQHMRRLLHRVEGRLLSSTAAGSGASAQRSEHEPRSAVSAAPPPADTITRARSASDPRAQALSKGDFESFDAIEMEKERAKRAR